MEIEKIEKWELVKGFEGFYEISNFGRVKSLDRIIKSKNQHGECFTKIKQKILSPGINNHGYCNVVLQNNGYKKTLTIHQLVAIAFIPNPENKPQVNHIDGDKTNNNDWNLEWSTNSENQLHSYNVLKTKPSNGNRKLLDSEISEIRNLYNTNKCTRKELQEKYSMSKSTIHSIVNNISWANI